MRLRVVGSSSAVPRAGSACSCYLIETERQRVIVDCGSGAVQSLRRFTDPLTLDAVLISHFHPDHVFDLVPLRYLRAFGGAAALLDVYVHPGGDESLRRLALACASADGERFFDRSMRILQYEPDSALQLKALRVTFAPARHYIPAYAMRFDCGAKSIVYSADTAPAPGVVDLARGADLFVCESSLGPGGADREPRGHSNAREAGVMARDAGVKQLLLTHYGDGIDIGELVSAARTAFDGPVTAAQDGLLLEV
ncbi:MAG TPA: MBL fold metallo-hydrolase [Candidatus Baltobacteraceae bacterium]|nr:MBL fold metallo-hydrolase [Candidatus Baltobacteraceae bacterium]